jgi:hypothetical protein
MRTETAAWQESIHKTAELLKDGMEHLHGAAIVRDEYVDKALDKHQARLDRQRRDMSGNYQRIMELWEENRQLREEVEEQRTRLRVCRIGYATADRFQFPIGLLGVRPDSPTLGQMSIGHRLCPLCLERTTLLSPSPLPSRILRTSI